MLLGSHDNELKATLQIREFRAFDLLTKDKSRPAGVQQQNTFSTLAASGTQDRLATVQTGARRVAFLWIGCGAADGGHGRRIIRHKIAFSRPAESPAR